MEARNLSSDTIKYLSILKSIGENKPVNLSLEDMPQIMSLTEEIKQAEEASKETFEQIETLKTEILERREKILELKSSIDPRLLYIKEGQAIPTMPAKTSNEGNGITKEKILEVLQKGSAGNAEIAKELGLEGKAAQNKTYGLCKTLESEGKVKSVNRRWELV